MIDFDISGVGRTIGAIETFRYDVLQGDGGEKYVVGVGVHYGAYVELGTSKMEAQPYLFPAARQVMKTEFQQIQREADSVDEVVEQVALRIEAVAKENAPVGETGNLRASIEAAPAGGAG